MIQLPSALVLVGLLVAAPACVQSQGLQLEDGANGGANRGLASGDDGEALGKVPVLEQPVVVVEAEEGPPHWIWAVEDSEEQPVVWFTRSFELPRAATGVRLRTGADNLLELFLDGDSIAVSDDWSRPVHMDSDQVQDLTARFGSGGHVLSALCENEGGPAGFWLELQLECEGGESLRIVSDRKWLVGFGDPSEWRAGSEASLAPADLGALGVAPWGLPSAWSSGTTPQLNDPLELEVAEGFRVELVYNVPRQRQGSWVSLAFDKQGRLYGSDQYGDLWRLTPNEGAGEPLVEHVDVALGEAHGLAFVGDVLYAVVSGAGQYTSGLHRLTDMDGDGNLDTVEELAAFDGTGEHGPHAVVPTKDGLGLWILAGNHTALPEFVERSHVPRLWDEDQLLPSFDDPNGHAVGRFAPAGWLARCDLNGENWVLHSSGMRNSYDVAENAMGDLFTFDADMEWDVGLPWYRPSRILHLVSGADFGWRTGSGKWPTYYLDTLPAVVDIGLTSPTGIAFGTGADFPQPWREALFVGDWAYGTIFAVGLEADGASYSGSFEVFVRGLPLPVTDLAVGADGALWFTVGGRRAQSGVYRVVWDPVNAASPQQIYASSISTGLPTLGALKRQRLEALHAPNLPSAVEIAWPDLDHGDRFVRNAARVAIEHQDVAQWRARALSENRPRAAAQALAALARAGEQDADAFYAAIGAFDLSGLDPDLQLDFLRALELGFLRVGAPSTLDDLAAFAVLVRSLPTGNENLDQELMKLAVFAANLGLEGVDVIPLLVARLEGAASQEEALEALYLLRSGERGWTPELTKRAWTALDGRGGTWTGGHSVARYVEQLREALQLVAPHPSGESAVVPSEDPGAEPAGRIRAAPFVQAWTLDDLVPSLARVRQERDVEQGQRAYFKASCDVCHRFDGEGGATGPDLTGVASRFGPADLLRTIVLPSETVADQYQDEEVWTTAGELFLGRVSEQADGSLTVHLVAPEQGTVSIPAEEVDLRRPHPLSRMPSGLIDVLTEEEILDLLAFLGQG